MKYKNEILITLLIIFQCVKIKSKRSALLPCVFIAITKNIGMRCNFGLLYTYVHITIHSHPTNDYDKIYYCFK